MCGFVRVCIVMCAHRDLDALDDSQDDGSIDIDKRGAAEMVQEGAVEVCAYVERQNHDDMVRAW